MLSAIPRTLLTGLALWVVATAALGECDPITPEYCPYPYPNSFYLVSDPSTATGYRLNLTAAAMPQATGQHMNPRDWNTRDGFSWHTSILTYLPGLSLTGLPGWLNIASSLSPSCPSVLLDTVTGERVAHWVELDERATSPERRSVIMWPAAGLRPNRRYIAAYGAVRSEGGSLIDPSPAFAALRDGLPSNDTNVNERRALFKDIFNRLTEAGVPQSSLTVAWDFHTGSERDVHERMLFMLRDSAARMPVDGPEFTIDSVTLNYSKYSNRRLIGRMRVPLYLRTELPIPSSRLVIGNDGLPVFQKWADCKFTVIVPNSLVESGLKGPFLQYGHGLFGMQEEVETGWIQRMYNSTGYVTGGVDWWGMAKYDIPTIADMIITSYTENFGYIPDRLAQSIVNHVYFTALLSSDAFATTPDMVINGQPVLDTTTHYYEGVSNGAIMGSVFMALSPHIVRGSLGSGGMPYSFLVLRSNDFNIIYSLIKTTMKDNEFDVMFTLPMFQLLWDRCSPESYAGYVTGNNFPGVQPKQVALQYALGDAQVTWLSTHILARTMNASLFPGNVKEREETFFGFPVAQGGVTAGATVQGWNFSAPLVPVGNLPPNKKTDTHECTRRDPRAQAQILDLFHKGVIVDKCGGPCDPLEPPIQLGRCPEQD